MLAGAVPSVSTWTCPQPRVLRAGDETGLPGSHQVCLSARVPLGISPSQVLLDWSQSRLPKTGGQMGRQRMEHTVWG